MDKNIECNFRGKYENFWSKRKNTRIGEYIIRNMGIEGTKLEMLFIKNSEKCDYNRQSKTLQKCKVSFAINMI